MLKCTEIAPKHLPLLFATGGRGPLQKINFHINKSTFEAFLWIETGNKFYLKYLAG